MKTYNGENFKLIELRKDHIAIALSDIDMLIIVFLGGGVSIKIMKSDIDEILCAYPMTNCNDTLNIGDRISVEFHHEIVQIVDLETNINIALTIKDFEVILNGLEPTNDTLEGNCPEEVENGSKTELNSNRKTSTSAVYDNVIQNIRED